MRWFFAGLVAAACFSAALAADQPDLSKRHGIEADLKTYPQGRPKEALESVLKALEDKKIDYFAAHLADPEFVDKRLKETASKFSEFVEETSARLAKDPATVKQMQRFLQEGSWEITEDRAVIKLKDVPDRWLYLRRIGDRWFLENRNKPEEMK
jgi:hypothetical protein